MSTPIPVKPPSPAKVLQMYAQVVPVKARKVTYKTVKILASLATLALVLWPELPSVGVTIPNADRWAGVLTAVIALLGHLADSNTQTTPPPV